MSFAEKRSIKMRQSARQAQLNASSSSNGSSNSSSNPITTRSKKLPRKFAQQVLDLELEIDQGTFTIDTVNQLILLYQQAVEYYNGISSTKYQTYESRMQNLFLREEVIMVMAKPTASADSEKRKTQREHDLERQRSAKELKQKKMLDTLA